MSEKSTTHFSLIVLKRSAEQRDGTSKFEILKLTLLNQLAIVVQGSVQSHPVSSRPTDLAGSFANVGNVGQTQYHTFNTLRYMTMALQAGTVGPQDRLLAAHTNASHTIASHYLGSRERSSTCKRLRSGENSRV